MLARMSVECRDMSTRSGVVNEFTTTSPHLAAEATALSEALLTTGTMPFASARP